jgi:YbgC/YbaW family acyl-CoA thioester hydrolase
MFSISVELGDGWIEPIYDHVHHGRCFSLLEQARLALLESVGVPNDKLLKEGRVLVITKVEAAYLREVKRGMVTVTCDRVEIEGRTIKIFQRILNERGKTAVEGVVSSMCMDIATRRGIALPEELCIALGSSNRN